MTEPRARPSFEEFAAWCRAAATEGRSGLPRVPAEPDALAALFDVLRANRLIPLVAHACAAAAAEAVDPVFAATTRAEARTETEHGLGALGQLRDVARALDEAGLEWMVWKGPALAAQVWGEATRRRFSDIDVIVRPEDRDIALAALLRAGWSLRDGIAPSVAAVVYDGQQAYPLDRPGALLVELHWGFAGRLYPPVAAVGDVMARAERVRIGGTEVRTPAGADALLLTALHATKHGWSQAEEVVTFARLCARAPEALRDAATEAMRAGVPRIVPLAARLAIRLGLLSEWTDHRPHEPREGEPHVAAAQEEDDRVRVERMADECIARMLAGDGAWRETREWTLSWIGRSGDRFSHLVGSVLHPTPMEPKWVTLPEQLAGLYPLVRVARLTLRSLGLAPRD